MLSFNELNRKDKNYLLALCSIIPFAVKAIDYVLLGSYIPFIVFFFAALIMLKGYYIDGPDQRFALRFLGIGITIWALFRFIIMILFLTTSVQEAHIENQFTFWFVLISCLYLFSGYYLIRSTKKLKTESI